MEILDLDDVIDDVRAEDWTWTIRPENLLKY